MSGIKGLNRINFGTMRRTCILATGLAAMAVGSVHALSVTVVINPPDAGNRVLVIDNNTGDSFLVTDSTTIPGLGAGNLLGITAIPGATSEFTDWSGFNSGVLGSASTVNPNTFTVGVSLGDLLQANFGPPQRSLTMRSDTHESGMSPLVNSITWYDLNYDAPIQTGPDPGYRFRVWGGALSDDEYYAVDDPGNESTTVEMDDNHEVKAYFSREYTLTMQNASGPSSPSIVRQLAEGDEYTVTVPSVIVSDTADHRYRCTGWAGGYGDIPANGTATSYGPYNVAATSGLNWQWGHQYRLLIEVVGDGEVSPGQNTNWWYDAGASASLIASPEEGSVFLGWFEGGAQIAGGNTTIPMSSGRYIQAQFAPASGDSDNDGLLDSWEVRYGLRVDASAGVDHGALGDPDNDGLLNIEEMNIALTNGVPTVPYASPIDADSDGDGMDDGYERKSIDPDTATGGDESFISAVIDRNNEAGRGAAGNPDEDLKWTTSTGYESIYNDLSNIEEWRGPDSEDPVTYETVAAGATSSDFWLNTLSKSVSRAIANPSDTADQSESNTIDTDEDGFDDGFEWSWDEWQRLNDTNIEVFVYGLLGDAITNEVPDWATARRFHPAVSHPDMNGVDGATDGDVLYDYESGGVSDAWYSDIREYHASDSGAFSPGVAGAPHSINRYQFPGYRRCSHPFYIDVDQDGLPDGYEVIFGLDPWLAVTIGDTAADAGRNPDGDYMAFVTNLIHRQVYDAKGYDPRTGWGAEYPDWTLTMVAAPNTRGYSYLDEARGIDGLLTLTPLGWGATSGDDATSPVKIDSDDDGIWDGWELYVGLNPNDAADATADEDLPGPDGLSHLAEFNSHTTGAGAGAPLPHWMNKILPTDPFDADTDGDRISDGTEMDRANAPGDSYTFREALPDGLFSTQTVAGGSWQIWASPLDMGGCYVGGGMNPTSADTDHDGLPDPWEASFGDTMDGALLDLWDDPDGDGLMNYQEYLAGATYHWQYDAWIGGAASYNQADFFYGTPKHWDWHLTCNHRTFNFIPYRGPTPGATPADYATCDPGDVDSDDDGMDDYWECFHGLNPTYGFLDLVASMIAGGDVPIGASVADPRDWPFVSGTPMMDPDADGIINVEESVGVSLIGPPTHHTDPTPFWMTDRSYDNSWVNLYFAPNDSVWYFSPPRSGPGEFPAPFYIYDFEINCGYDTDNDNKADYDEIVDGSTDPVDDESPIRRHALFLPETGGYARTRGRWFHFNDDMTMLREFTVEAWANPMTPAKGSRQVVVERPFLVSQGNPMDLTPGIRLNFRLGLDANGQPFAAYNGNGTQSIFVEALAGAQWALASNEWTHLATSYEFQTEDQHGRLKLYVNGLLAATVISDELPITGYVGVTNQFINFAPMMIGASDLNPMGSLYGGFAPPDPTSFFHGWIDEVRIWDGARSAVEIAGTMERTLSRAQATSEMTTSSSMLVSRYGFDDLPDPQHGGIVPDGFAFTMASIRPADWTSVAWWAGSAERSTVYTDYMYLPWISDTTEHFPFVPPIDVGDPAAVTNDAQGNAVVLFPNPANPYGDVYLTGHAFSFEDMAAVTDVLPCRAAEADADVAMWDEGGPGTGPYDTDGDGLPDEWEEQNGLDPLNPSGEHGGHGDRDSDGLSNLGEYKAGTDPNSYDTGGNGFADFFAWSGIVYRVFGELYNDFDGMQDEWEVLSGLDPNQFDAHLDTDDDGFNNFAEFMSSVTDSSTCAVALPGDAGYYDPSDMLSCPFSTVVFTFDYSGMYNDGPIRVEAYQHAGRDDIPDLSFVYPSPGAGPTEIPDEFPHVTSPIGASIDVTRLSTNHFSPGDWWFFAFFDNNRDNNWSPGEPAGVAQGEPIHLEWGGPTAVEIGFTDQLPGYERFSWPTVAGALEYEVSVSAYPSGVPVIDARTLRAPRNYVHEGDYQYAGLQGLAPQAYEWTVTHNSDPVASDTFEITYPTTQSVPAAISPLGSVLHYADNEFRWTMDESATRAGIQIARDAGFTDMLWDGGFAAPWRHADGSYRSKLPIYAGDGNFTNGVYYWRVFGWNPNGWSANPPPVTMTIDLADDVMGPYSISGDINYFGKVTNGAFIVRAYDQAAPGGRPASQFTIPNTASGATWPVNAMPYVLRGLLPGQYSLWAFLDQDGDGVRDEWETYGFARECYYAPKLVVLPPSETRCDIQLTLTDVDNDKIADDWEFHYAGDLVTMGPGPVDGYTDWSMNGVSDYAHYAGSPMNISPVDPDAAGADGIPLWVKVAFDMDYFAYYAFTVTTVGTDESGVNQVRWSAPSGTSIQMLGSGMAQTSNNGVTLIYRLQYSQDLITWTDLQGNPPVTYDAVDGKFEILDVSGTNGQGFYRVFMNCTR